MHLSLSSFLVLLVGLKCTCGWSASTEKQFTLANNDASIWTQQNGNLLTRLYLADYRPSEIENESTFLFKETYNGIETTNQRILRYRQDGSVDIIESFNRIPSGFSTKADKKHTQAISDCTSTLPSASQSGTPSWKLVVLPFRSSFTMAYIITIHLTARDSWICLVNATLHNSDVLFTYSNVRSATGISAYNGNVTFQTSLVSGTYFMEDTKQSVFNCNDTSCDSTTRISNYVNQWNNSAAVSVAWAVQQTFNYFWNAHGRNGMNGVGGPGVILSASGTNNVFPHFISANISGAQFTTEGIYYGVTNANPHVSLDVVAHEWAHGVLHSSIPGGNGMNYYDESGALEESFCDVIGAMVDAYVFGESANTWTIGENLFAPSSGTALRYLANPPAAMDKNLTLDDDPDHYSKRYIGPLDNGGVHVNSGIPNKAFYLLAKGGNHPNGGPTMTGAGITNAAQVWYQAFTQFMTSTSTFLQARDATERACNQLFGPTSSTCNAVKTSWGLCGVGDIPILTPTQLVTNPTCERSQNPYTLTGTGISYYSTGAYGYGGSRGYFALGSASITQGSLFTNALNLSSTLTNATFTFQMRIDTDETATTQKDTLTVEVRHTNGTFLETLASYSNLNQTGFSYIKRGPFMLNQWKGLPIKIVFKVFTDSYDLTYFYIDEIYAQVVQY